jgi:hypothetical protein
MVAVTEARLKAMTATSPLARGPAHTSIVASWKEALHTL